MGVSSLQNRVAYNGDGVTTSFPFAYYFFLVTDLKVYKYVTATGIATLQNFNSDYTVTGTPNTQGLYTSGGSVNMIASPAVGEVLIVFRNGPESQVFSLTNSQTIPSAALVQQLDYLTLLTQYLNDELGRCVRLPDGFGGTFDGSLPSNISLNPLYYLQVNAAGTGLQLSNTNTQLPYFSTLTVPYTSVQTAGLSNPVPLFTLPAGYILTNITAKHSTAFIGGSISAVSLQVGPVADYSKYLNLDVFQAPGDQIFDNNAPDAIESWANGTVVYGNFTSIGANLSALTQGSVTIFYGYLPV